LITTAVGFGELEIYKFDQGIGQLRLADLNNNGRTDVLLWNARRNRIELLYQPDESLPPAKPERPTEPNELTHRGALRVEHLPVAYRVATLDVADVTGDSRPDIIFYGEPRELVVLPGLPEGGFGPADAIRAPEGDPSDGRLAVGDFNHDGRADVALLGQDLLLVFYQKPDGGLAQPLRIPHSIRQPIIMLAADVDGDGRDDLTITTDDNQYGVVVLLQEPTGGLGPSRRLAIPKLRSMTFAPTTDRPDDLFAVEAATGRLIHYRWETPEATAAVVDWPLRLHPYPVLSKSKRRPTALGDLTGSGRPDVIAADPDAAQLILFRQTDTGLAPGVAFPGLMKTLDVQIVALDGRPAVLSVSADEKMIGVSRYEDGRLSFAAPLAVSGDPLAATIGPLTPDGPAQLIYLTRVKDRAQRQVLLGDDADTDAEVLLCVTSPDGKTLAQVQPATPLEDDPLALRLADLNQDGRADLLVFFSFGSPAAFVQDEAGALQRFRGADKREGLIKDATLEGFTLADVTGDGRPEVIFAQKNVARALAIRDGAWAVVDQYNPEKSDARLSAVTALPGEPGSPTLVLYDKQGGELLVFARRADKTYAVTQTMPIGQFEPTAMLCGPLGADGRPAVFIADAAVLAVLRPDELAPTFINQFAYETDTRDGFLGDAVIGDLNGAGVRDVVAVDIRKANLEVLATMSDGSLERALRFQVFQGKRFAGEPDRGGEPSAVLMGDVNGDGLADIVCIVHDRVIVYPGQ